MGRLLVVAALASGVAAGAAGDSFDEQEQELRQIVDARRTGIGIMVSLESSSLFDGDSAIVKPSALEQIARVGDLLAKRGDIHVLVEGFADSSGSIAHDEALSLRWARAVRDLLASRGVEQRQLFVEGMGSAEPVADDSTPEGRARNRRIEIHVWRPRAT